MELELYDLENKRLRSSMTRFKTTELHGAVTVSGQYNEEKADRKRLSRTVCLVWQG
jgi:hypothetical protein